MGWHRLSAMSSQINDGGALITVLFFVRQRLPQLRQKWRPDAIHVRMLHCYTLLYRI
jgi:hypothetical protein